MNILNCSEDTVVVHSKASWTNVAIIPTVEARKTHNGLCPRPADGFKR